MVKRLHLVLALLLSLAAVAAVSAQSAAATTRPINILNVRVTVTDSALTMSHYRAHRGWGAHFIVTNRGRLPHRVDIGGLLTPVLAPGRRAKVSASLEERGRFPFKVTLNSAGRKHAGWFIVF
jgi:hypothetical protein